MWTVSYESLVCGGDRSDRIRDEELGFPVPSELIQRYETTRALPIDDSETEAKPKGILVTTEALRAARQPRELLPAWLLRMLRPARFPSDWTRVCATTVGIGGPQLAGLITGRTEEAVLVSIGALCVSLSDLTTTYRYRLARVGLTALFGAIGFAAGAAVGGSWWALTTVVAISLPSVLCSRMGDLWAAAGAQMLTFCVVATGQTAALLTVTDKIVWFVAGELLLVGMVAATWPLRRAAPVQDAVAGVFDATLDMFEAAGTAAAITRRQDLTRALNNAHDMLISTASDERSRAYDRLYMIFTHATPIVEAVVAATHAGIRPPERVFSAIRNLARAVRTGELPAPYRPEPTESAPLRALNEGIADLTDACRSADRPAVPRESRTLRERFRMWRNDVTLGHTAWMLVVRMALCLAAAELIGLLSGLDESHWIALTVAFVLKPNSGSVFARTVLRAIGTVLGVVVALVLLAMVPPGWWMAPFLVAFAAKAPIALNRHYGLFTAVVTVLVLLMMGQTRLFHESLPEVRLINDLIGCAIVLGFTFLLRPFGKEPSFQQRFAAVTEPVAEYVSLALAGIPQGRSTLRRRTYRELSDLRAALQQQLMKPTAARAERWWPTITVLERVVDAATERALLIDRETDESRLQYTQRLVSNMRTVTRQLRSGSVSPETLRDQLEQIYAQVASA